MAELEIQNGGAANKAPIFTALKPQLFVEALKANDAVEFYKTAFAAEEIKRTLHPKRKADEETPSILSAELSLGGFSFLVSESSDDHSTAEKVDDIKTRVVFILETEDIETAVSNAVSAGAVTEGEIVDGDGPYSGRRVATLKDPFGFIWVIGAPTQETADVEA